MGDEFQNLKSQFGGRVSSVQMRDANAERQELSRETGPIYTSRLVFRQAGRRIEIAANSEFGCVSISGDFDVPLLTVNGQDRCGFTSFSIGAVRIGSFDYEVFTKDGVATDSQNQLLHSSELAGLISIHPFRKGEALHFYRNRLILYVRREDLSAMLVRRMLALAEIIPAEGDATELELPAQFADLKSTLNDWAITDDQERSDKIEDASEQELGQLLAVVEPRLRAINSYLGGPKENSSNDAAANLEAIAEAAIEARAALLTRKARNN
jgi:hypothetical protein